MKSSFLFLCLLSFLAPAPRVVAGDCRPLSVRNPQGNYIIPGVQGDIVYRRVDGHELALDAYVQKRGTRRPGVILVHGGGYTAGSRAAFTGQLMEMLTRAGYNWFAIDYRKKGPANANASLDDLRAALAFIRCHAGEFRVDPDRLALLGEDTGAQMAALLAAEKPAGVKALVMIGAVFPAPGQTAQGLPDALVAHGTADREITPQQATTFCDGLKSAGNRCEFLPVEQAIHRAENWWPEQWAYKTKIIAWLNRRLQLPAPDHEPYGGALRKDIVYDTAHDLKLDAYVPAGRGPFPAVIIAHGGGWEAGDKVTYATPLFEPLAKAGFAWFSIDYRLTPAVRNADQLDDLRAAIRFVATNARRFRIDPRRIAILGESASGQMVAQLATESPQHVAAVVSFYGVYDFAARVKNLSGELAPRSLPTRLFGLTKLDDTAYDKMRRYSPLHNVRKDMPPLLLICGTKDGLYAGQMALAKRLDELGARYEAMAIDGAPHGVENWEGHPEWMHYKEKLVAWLRKSLAKS
ncbi:MAG: alpha/beta hydrolase [Blastocatellia bacterium]